MSAAQRQEIYTPYTALIGHSGLDAAFNHVVQTVELMLGSEATRLQQQNDHLLQPVEIMGAQIADLRGQITNFNGQITVLRDDRTKLQTQVERLQEKNTSHLKKMVSMAAVKHGATRRTHLAKGRETRAQVWQDCKARVMVDNLPPPCQELPDVVISSKEHIETLVKRTFTTDKEMYGPATSCLQPIFSFLEGHFLMDTHAHRNPDGQPDLCVYRGQRSMLTISTFVELKVQPNLTDSDLGQCIDYLFAMQRYQPGRSVYVALLSNVMKNVVMTLRFSLNNNDSPGSTRGDSDYHPRITLTGELTLVEAIGMIVHYLRIDGYDAPKSPFSPELGALDSIIGSPTSSVVGVFQVPSGETRELMAVKVVPEETAGYRHEIDLLSPGPVHTPDWTDWTMRNTVPDLVWDKPDNFEFGIRPVGQPFRKRYMPTTRSMQGCMRDVLSALMWIHKHGIIHCDVRTDNIIIVPDPETPGLEITRAHAVLIGFDSAANAGKITHYAGGYICTPPKLLEHMAMQRRCQLEAEKRVSGRYTWDTGDDTFQHVQYVPAPADDTFQHVQYVPAPADDLHSFIVLLVQVQYPHSFHRFDSGGVQNPDSFEFSQLQLM
ncbi:hypothetical protein FN846DRAFT_908520 [Sphaerosporella brunnea]|uniref:non-specific serine/threonine protein kinase n=1 Tax=Sphaerosporella brunnea TaxID=1250544 RepID=A0A5J5ETD1_9PEZI|nr:hypothetical protein FN846DRAFT_908520 [Sphaerosporella brunnea]